MVAVDAMDVVVSGPRGGVASSFSSFYQTDAMINSNIFVNFEVDDVGMQVSLYAGTTTPFYDAYEPTTADYVATSIVTTNVFLPDTDVDAPFAHYDVVSVAASVDLVAVEEDVTCSQLLIQSI